MSLVGTKNGFDPFLYASKLQAIGAIEVAGASLASLLLYRSSHTQMNA